MTQPAKCATRGCKNTPPPRFTKCADCLLGKKRLDKFAAQRAAVDELPPLAAVPDGFAFRVAGSPVAWNNALVRPRQGRPFLTDRAREWKKAVATYATAARPREWSLNGLFAVEIHSTFSRSNADADGPLKLIIDALQGVAYDNDRQVRKYSGSKSVNPAAPHVVITIQCLPRELFT